MLNMWSNAHRTAVAVCILGTVCILCLAPFVNKAFHIDDPVFLWVAGQIQSHPFDFYGFTGNWNGTDNPVWDIQKNPPLASYYIALAAYWFGWSEKALHILFLVPALAAAIGIYYLARELSARPLEAALISMLTPVFMLSSTSLMCDTLMLSFWIWAVVFWIQGIRSDRPFCLFCAALLIAACSLTKYYGISLIPLLLAYSLAEKRSLGHWTLFLSIPVFILAAYQWLTYSLYGRGLLIDAFSYATEQQSFGGAQRFTRALTGLAFTGGCLITTLFYSPLLWRRRILVFGSFLIMLIAITLPLLHMPNAFPLLTAHGEKWLFVIQFSLFTVAGVNVLLLAIADLWKRRDGDALLLLLWVSGTVIFASFLNWSVNGRSILPIVPVAGILVIRRVSERERARQIAHNAGRVKFIFPLVPALLLVLWVNWSDYRFADSARIAAAEIHHRYGKNPGTLWFLGHWGFQYYMESHGGKPVEFKKSTLSPGDIVILPLNNSHVYSLTSQNSLGIIDELRVPSARGLATMDSSLGAGFYSDFWGSLPFALGTVRDERYFVFLVMNTMKLQ